MRHIHFRLIPSLFFILLLPSHVVFAKDTHVNGYYRSDGTYVEPYTRSEPNAYRWDNKSYTPNQPSYNSSYYEPTKRYNSDWYQPSDTRYNDSNLNNDVPSYNMEMPKLPSLYDER